jgi:electron-transferring-flavoprotein dehydrogenase
VSTEKLPKIDTLIVGAGSAGLCAALKLKNLKPDQNICVIDKAASAGNHNLSGAAVEKNSILELLDSIGPKGKETIDKYQLLSSDVGKDQVFMFMNSKFKISMKPLIKMANFFGLGPGKMQHKGDCLLSVSKLSKCLSEIAIENGIEVIYGFSVKDIIFEQGKASGVILVEQGLDKDRNKQPNYIPEEKIHAERIILCEGCDGLVTKSFISKAGLKRKRTQLYSVGIKEIIKVSDQQYKAFGENTSVHAMGYPIWIPFKGPAMFGGGVMYSMGDNMIAVIMITALDWKECDFNPQDALEHFKHTEFASRYISGGQIIEAGAKMIPEGGWLAVPRDPQTNAIGKANVIIAGDSAGFVNMQKIKGVHLAIKSGLLAAEAIAESETVEKTAEKYTYLIDNSLVAKELKAAENYRQTIAKFGMLAGLPLSALAPILPRWKIEPDYLATETKRYKLKINKEFDKDTFTSLASTAHREDQPSHLLVLNSQPCLECKEKFDSPCITFCPAGVYERINGTLKAANPSNCLHCKTCQRKCPYDNIRWTVPEGGGGPKYINM